MGSGVSTGFQPPFELNGINKEKSFVQLKNLSKIANDGNGNQLVRFPNNKVALLITRTDQNGDLTQMLKTLKARNYRHLCNLIEFSSSTKLLLCGCHKNIQALFQFEDHNLQKEIELKSKEKQFFRPLQILKVLKFMIDVIEELAKYKLKNVQFNLKSIIIKKSDGIFKFANFESIIHSERVFETFYCYQKSNNHFLPVDQSSMIFSVGMVLLCLAINENCSDCYDYKNMRFLQSVFEQKIEKMDSVLTHKKIESDYSLMNPSSNGETFQEQLNLLIRESTICTKYRINIQNLKQRYQNLLNSLAANNSNVYLGSSSFTKSNKERGKLQLCYTKSRTEKNDNNAMKIHCYSTHEFLVDPLSTSCISKIKDSTNLIRKPSFKSSSKHQNHPIHLKFNREMTKKGEKLLFKQNVEPA